MLRKLSDYEYHISIFSKYDFSLLNWPLTLVLTTGSTINVHGAKGSPRSSDSLRKSSASERDKDHQGIARRIKAGLWKGRTRRSTSIIYICDRAPGFHSPTRISAPDVHPRSKEKKSSWPVTRELRSRCTYIICVSRSQCTRRYLLV